MAVKRGRSAAPAKQVTRKKHGPKRKMFHQYNKATRIEMAKCGVLSKYSDFESFALSCNARGVKSDPHYLWNEFIKLPTRKEQDEYLKTIKERSVIVAKQIDDKAKKVK